MKRAGDPLNLRRDDGSWGSSDEMYFDVMAGDYYDVTFGWGIDGIGTGHIPSGNVKTYVHGAYSYTQEKAEANFLRTDGLLRSLAA